MRKYVIVCTILAGTAGCRVNARDAQLSNEHKLQLQIDQKDVIIVGNQLQQLKATYNDKVAAFNTHCADYIKADGFPANAICDLQNATVTIPPAPEPTKAEPKPDAKKK